MSNFSKTTAQLLKLFFSLFFILLYFTSNANTYYFSSSSGDDSRSALQAQQIQTPWRNLSKLQQFFDQLNPGDSILFKRADVFFGSILITKSGEENKPIVFSSYGIGDRPIISGFTKLTNWTSTGGGVSETTSPQLSDAVGMLVVNGAATPIGRYPNSNASNKGYLTIASTNGSSQITDNTLSSTSNWSGGEVVIRKARWVLDRNLITSHNGSLINYISQSPNQAYPNFGYFIQNHPGTLDMENEWYYNTTQKKLGIFLGSKDPFAYDIKATSIETLITLNNKQHIVFDEIRFEGANTAAFQIEASHNIAVQNCEIDFSGTNAVNASSSSQISIQYCIINHTNNIALNFTGCTNGTIRNNTIKNTGTTPGMGKGDSGAYEAIMIDGDNHLIELNQIDSTGYIPITFRGNLYTIRNNFITNYTIVKDDGGAIYTWNNIPNAPLTYGTKITGNIILNGIGAGEGTDNPTYKASNGIYMDDNTANAEITGNTVANCALNGIYIHNAHEITLNNNTMFNNGSQIVMSSDAHAAYSTIRNIRMLNNVFISKQGDQPTAAYKTESNDIKEFGFFDSNYYCRPVNDFMTINTSYQNNGYQNNTLDLEGWKAMYGKDNASKKSPLSLASPDMIRFEYNERTTAKTITLDGDYIDVKSNSYKGSLTLQPFSSVVLLKQPALVTYSACATGSIALELWNNIDGNDVSNIPLQKNPDVTTSLQVMELQNLGDHYGSRMRGYICPPLSGTYTFFIAGDDAAELWLSTSSDPLKKRRIASFLSWTNFREWDKFSAQKSSVIKLQAGVKYYIEVLHKEGAGGDHVSVAWQLPNGELEAPISGNRISPFGEKGLVRHELTASFSKTNQAGLQVSVYPNPFSSATTIKTISPAAETVTITLLDSRGSFVKNVYRGAQKMNTEHIAVLHSKGLANGVYILRVASGKQVVTQSIAISQ